MTAVIDASSMRPVLRRRSLWFRVGYHHAVLRRVFSRGVKVWTWRKRLLLWWYAVDLALS